MNAWHVVHTASELLDAVARQQPDIEVRGTLSGLPMITLAPGMRLRGGSLHFGARGIRLSRDNELSDLIVRTADREIAIFNDTAADDLGTLSLRDVRTIGQVLLVADDAVRSGHILIRGLHVLNADLRGREQRPRLVGVDALPGAVTVWNRQPDPQIIMTADLTDISVGTARTPVRGSGLMVGGRGAPEHPAGGVLSVPVLRTGEVHVNGGIPPSTPDLICAGVLVIPGAMVDQVINDGPVTTEGPNDMALDNSGEVATWTANAPVTTHGPSGIGFVNFGAIQRLDIRAPIITYGTGARGFNHYDGSLRDATFHSVATHGDGAIGVQIGAHLPTLEITGDLVTHGGQGQSLVKGIQTTLSASALSVLPGGHLGTVAVGGMIRTLGNDVTTVEIRGRLDHLHANAGISAVGHRSDAIHHNGRHPDLADIPISTTDGTPLVQTP